MNLKNNNVSELRNAILLLHGFIIVLLLAYFGKFLFIPLFFSFLVAVSLYPLCRWFEKHRLNRLLSSILCILLLLLIFAAIIYFFGSQIQRFAKDLPALKDKFDILLKNAEVWLQQNYDIDDGLKANYINKYVNTMERAIGFTVAGFFEVLIFVTLSVFFIFYMLLYRELLRNFILLLFNQANKKRVSVIASMLNTTIVNYIKGLLIEMGILILLSSVTLLILGVKYAILMAFVAGIFNIIPYIGIYTAALLNMLITLTDGSGEQSVEVLLVFVIIHIIDANLITPFIVGKRIKINPLVTLIAVIAGKMIWGIPGMFLFIPLAAIVKIIIEKTTGLQTDKISN